MIDIDQGHSGASAADREGFQHLVAEVSLGRAGIVLGLECSRLARNSADWHQLLELCGMTGTLICDEDGLYDPRNFNDRLLLGIKGHLSEAELHFIQARLRGGDPVQGPPRRADHAAARRPGLRRRRARHPRPRHRHPGRAAAPVRHVRGHRVGHRRASRRSTPPGCPSPGGTTKAPARARPTGSRCGTPPCCACCTTPATPARSPTAGTADQLLPGGKRASITVPREEWISFIPGAHPGYITLDQYEANIARLAANAAAHGRDRAAGPPREGPALLQGIIICGRCGGRMTVRYHARGGKDLPTYLCQRDGIDNARPICAAIPGHTLDEHIGQLLIDTLTPLAVEAALQVSAELEHRAAEADALRAAHVERARYHADLARRRYLAVDPANRLVADTLEADWNTALRALNDAQAAYDKAREQHDRQLTDAQKARIAQLVTDLPGIWNDPATPMRERKRIARLLLTDVTVTRTSDTITAHARLAGGQHRTLTLPVPEPAWKIRQTKASHHHRDRQAAGPPHLRRDRQHPPQPRPAQRQGRPFNRSMVERVIRTYQLRSRRQRLLTPG